MAAGTWTVYNSAKNKLGGADIDLNGDTFKMALFTSASNANTATLITYASLTNQVANGNGYLTTGKTLTSVTWSAGASAGQQKLGAANITWTASSGTIPNIRYAVILDNSKGASAGARPLLCRVALSSGQFTIADGNTLQVNTPATGIFTLT